MKDNKIKSKKALGRPKHRPGCESRQVTVSMPVWLCEELDARYIKAGFPSRAQFIEDCLMVGCGYNKKTYAMKCEGKIK